MHDRPLTFMERSQDGLRQLLHDLEALFEGDRNFGVCAPALVASDRKAPGDIAGTTVRLSSLILPDAQPSPPSPAPSGQDTDEAGVCAMLRQVLANQALILQRLDRLEQLVRPTADRQDRT